MLGRTFKTLREFRLLRSLGDLSNYSRHNGLQVDLPACTTLELQDCPMDFLRFLSCSNVQILHWSRDKFVTFDLAEFNSLHDFLFNLSCLQNLDIYIPRGLGLESLVHFVFCGALERRVWRDIRSVKVEVGFTFDRVVEDQPRYEKWWKSFTVKQPRYVGSATITASM